MVADSAWACSASVCLYFLSDCQALCASTPQAHDQSSSPSVWSVFELTVQMTKILLPDHGMWSSWRKTGGFDYGEGVSPHCCKNFNQPLLLLHPKRKACCKSFCKTPPTVPQGEPPCAPNLGRFGCPERRMQVFPHVHAMAGSTCPSLRRRPSEPPSSQPSVNALQMAEATIGEYGHGWSANDGGK